MTQYQPDTAGIETPRVHHFYGYDIRGHFLAGTLVLIIEMFADRELLFFNLLVGVLGIFLITILAALTTPKSKFVMLANLIVSGLMFLFFEYLAIGKYLSVSSVLSFIFILRQVVALIFLSSFYLSLKSVRDMFGLEEV